MFQPRFAPKVEDGSKIHTIRGYRKRPIVVGELLSLREWTGKPYRSKQRILREEVCIAVEDIIIDEHHLYLNRECVWEDLARNDGFSSYEEMLGWFSKTHRLPFSGVLIEWKPSARASSDVKTKEDGHE